MKIEHTTVSGHRIELELEEAARVFFARVHRAAEDKRVSENDLIALIYSDSNPILQPGIIPGRGMVTKETLENPLYRVLQDLLDRKRIAKTNIDVERMADRYSMPLAGAAEQLGVHESAVRQAIAAGRLPSWKKNGQHYLAPEAVAAFQLHRRGPAPRAPDAKRLVRAEAEKYVKRHLLNFFAGNADGISFRVKAKGAAVTPAKGKAVSGQVADWNKIGVIYGGEGKHRFLVLVPANENKRITRSKFFVEGAFEVAEKENNPRRAREAWDAFEPS